MIIKVINEEYLGEMKKLYEEEGWTSYLKDDRKLRNAIGNSEVMGLFSHEELIGFIRYLTDFEHILYIQDLIIAKEYRGSGRGQVLMESLLKKYPNIRSRVLITDIGDKVSNRFYEKMNFQKAGERGMVSYVR